MVSRLMLRLMLLLIAVFPIAAQAANRVIFILVDAKQNRAYIPEGTVLPVGLQLRAEPAAMEPAIAERHAIEDESDDRFRRPLRKRVAPSNRKRLTGPALVFEYAPSERFTRARQQYAAQRQQNHSRSLETNDGRYCIDIFVSDEVAGYYGTYYNGYMSTFCGPNDTTIGNSYLWEFIATGDHSDKDQTISPYVWIDDDNGNFSCFDEYAYPGDNGTCTASATTQWTNSGCTNTVYTSALLYVIEYLPGYQENYLGFNLQMNWCTTFY